MEEIRRLFAENKRVVILLAVFIILVVIAFLLSYNVFEGTADGEPVEEADKEKLEEALNDKEKDPIEIENTKGEETVDILPERNLGNNEEKDRDMEGIEEYKEDAEKAFLDPFSGPMELKGVVLKKGGDSFAIIHAEGRSHIVREGDIVLDGWKVAKITRNSVTLESGDRDTRLKLD